MSKFGVSIKVNMLNLSHLPKQSHQQSPANCGFEQPRFASIRDTKRESLCGLFFCVYGALRGGEPGVQPARRERSGRDGIAITAIGSSSSSMLRQQVKSGLDTNPTFFIGKGIKTIISHLLTSSKKAPPLRSNTEKKGESWK
ncbi:hypothetical protein D3C87_482850 [compost metagenome]